MKSVLKLSGFLLLSTGTMGASIQELSDQCDGLRGELITAMNNVKLAERNHVAAEAGFEAAAAAASSAVNAYQFANDVSSLRRQMKSGHTHALRAFGKQNAGLHNGVCSGNIDRNSDVDCSSGKPSTCLLKASGTRHASTPCIEADDETACDAKAGGACVVAANGANDECAFYYEKLDCNNQDLGTCAVASGGTNSHCAAPTTQGACTAASDGTALDPITSIGSENACVFSAVAANDCVWTPNTANDCVFTAGNVRLTVNAGPNVANGGGSTISQQVQCCTDKYGVVNDKFVFEIGDYKSSFESYEKIYDDLFKIKEDIKQQESSACNAYAAAAAALTA